MTFTGLRGVPVELEPTDVNRKDNRWRGVEFGVVKISNKREIREMNGLRKISKVARCSQSGEICEMVEPL